MTSSIWNRAGIAAPHYIRKWLALPPSDSTAHTEEVRKIITVSRFECERISKALQIPADRITAIYNGYSTHFSPLPEVDMHIVQQYIPEKGFLFFLGNTDPKKNTERVLKHTASICNAPPQSVPYSSPT